MNFTLLLEAAAATEEAAEQPSLGAACLQMLPMLIIYAIIIFAMWFFFMRPQKKEQKRIKEMLSQMTVGDCILTTSGFYGIVIDINDDTVIVEFGNNRNCRIPMDRSAISRVEKAEVETESK